jgi:hypothetical protein
MKKLFIVGIMLLLINQVQSGTPVWTFTPLTGTTISLPPNGNHTIQYRVTNQSKKSHTLALQSINNVSQTTTSGNCANPFTLGYLESCILTLVINGSELTENIVGGPVVCDAIYPLQCYQPSQADSLTILKLSSAETISISASPSNISLTLADATKNFTITNNSTTVTATNIVADLSGTALNGNVTQDSSDCDSVLPGQTCVVSFTRKTTAVTSASVPIQGDNTTQVGVSIAVDIPTEATIAVSSGSPLVLDGTTGTPVAGTITMINNATLITATNVAAVLTGTALDGEVTQDATDCASVSPGNTCTLSFTPGSTAVSTTTVTITGDNTSETTATIAVNAAPEASIAISSGTPLNLSTSSSGTMTILNNSSTEIATNINSNFTGTALNGFVTQTASTCSSVNPGSSCTLTFTSGSTDVAETNFPIQGDNTTAVTGAMDISSSLTTLLTGGNGSGGNIFNVTNISPVDLTITSFDINLSTSGNSTEMIVYYLQSAATGFETSSSGWTSLGTSTVTSNGTNVATPLPIGGVTIPAGSTYGIYVALNTNSGSSVRYTNGSSTFANSQLSIETLTGRGYPPFTGGIFSPRQWNGTIYYTP